MNVKNIITGVFFAVVVILLIVFVAYKIWFEKGINAGVDYSLRLTEVLLVIATGVALVAAVINIVHHPKESLKIVAGVVVLGVIGLIGYSVSDGEILKKYLEFGVEKESQSRWVDTGLYLMYGTLAIAIIGIIAAEINSAFKN